MFTVESCSKVKHLIGALNMRANILDVALRALNYYILNEVEYPDAFYKVATNLELNTREKHALMEMYDNQDWSK